MASQFDLVVIGAGPGGYVAAIRAAQLGMKVACVEKGRTLGGTCLNVGCIPSKAMLDSSELYHLARERFKKHGIVAADIKLDLPAMLARKDEVVKGLTDGVRYLFRKNRVEPIFGTATLRTPTSVAVALAEGGSTEVSAGHILLATGSEPVSLPSLPFDGQTVVDSTGALALTGVPEHLVVVGAGYIGLELGSLWKRLGAKVTVLEFLPRIVPTADHEMGELLRKSLTRQGLEFHLETKVKGASVERGRASVLAERNDGTEARFDCDCVLVAVGRRPLARGLGLETVGVAVDPKTGRVPVDARYRTSVPTILAIGDLIAGPMLAHKAEDEGIAVAENLAGKPGHVDYNTIPGVIYTDPELAGVGLTEEEVKDKALKYRVGKFPFLANGRAKAMDQTEGQVKILADAVTDRVLGVHVLGPQGVGIDRRGGDRDGIRRQRRGHRAHLPRPSDALGSRARGGPGRRWAVDSQLIYRLGPYGEQLA